MMASQIRNELGPVDILVNDAGAYPRRTCRAFTPTMIERGLGRIINVSSVNARIGRAGLTAYSTAKTGALASRHHWPGNLAHTASP
ncbi:SDR family NAD(P)-dependent oxidoreductase [Streptomyces sp. NPDC006656]|uniref:SDR family NAD(P)-dependent oxidoreductase n=1 Tax=Streptomyces sp. NPDC006656 TaxID=3156899 RepID=UPI0034512CDC